MTESFGPYCGDPLDRDLPADKRGSCGRPFVGVEVRIVAVDDGTEAAVGETGEIQLRGPNVMRGICGRPRGDVFTPDGFYPTGDLGYVDGDGYLFFTGRLDDMFKVKGATVYPSEVEAALHANPDVQRAVVVDVGDAPATRSARWWCSSRGATAPSTTWRVTGRPPQRVQGADRVGDRRGRRDPHDGDGQGRQGRRAGAPGLSRESAPTVSVLYVVVVVEERRGP